MNYRELLCDCPEDGAKLGLLALMAGISEECWCSGWMMENEFACWQAAAAGRAQNYGQNVITVRQAKLLKLLSDEAGGWWIWDHKPRFVRLDEWLESLSAARMP